MSGETRYGYVVTALDGDLGCIPGNIKIGTVLIEKRPRGAVTSWDFINMTTGAFGYVAGRKIGKGHVEGRKVIWDGGTLPEAAPPTVPPVSSVLPACEPVNP